MAEIDLNYDSLMDQYAGQKPTQLLGQTWLIESLTRTNHPIRGSEVRMALTMQPDPSGKCTSGSLRLVFRDEVEEVSLPDGAAHIARCKGWAKGMLLELPTGAALSALINALEFCPETREHEAIERGRQEMLAGRLETREQFLAFIESIT